MALVNDRVKIMKVKKPILSDLSGQWEMERASVTAHYGRGQGRSLSGDTLPSYATQRRR